MVSLGHGIELEAITLVFERFKNEGYSSLFLPRCDTFAAIKTQNPAISSMYTTQPRLEKLKTLGAITALCLIHGQPPIPFDPLFLHFIINNCNIQSLHRSFVGEWHQELRHVIDQWLQMGPNGDAMQPIFMSHFASYHDTSVSLYFILLKLSFLMSIIIGSRTG